MGTDKHSPGKMDKCLDANNNLLVCGRLAECGPINDKIKEGFEKLNTGILGMAQKVLEKQCDKSLEVQEWKYKQQVQEVKYNHARNICERLLLKAVLLGTVVEHAITENMQDLDDETTKIVQEIKEKQWCISCGEEASFQCCPLNSYCSDECKEWIDQQGKHKCDKAFHGVKAHVR